MRAIGLMSGTSLDGMDAALIETDGTSVQRYGPALTMPFNPKTKTALKNAVDDALQWRFEGAVPASFAAAGHLLAVSAKAAVLAVMQKADADAAAIDVVGFHGQTVLHIPPHGGACGQTCQIGDAQWLAHALSVPVVHDFRTPDMQAGGHGAPFAPGYHMALAANLPKPVMILNVGGVGNLTWLGENDEVLAFDTGPANGPIDAWVSAHNAGSYDAEGALAAKGRVDETRLKRLMAAPYFTQTPPKSADRWEFDDRAVHGLSLQDGAATLTAWCAQSIANALAFLPQKPVSIAVCGGGRKNPVLMALLREYTQLPVVPAEDMGWRGDALEAEAFAYLAVRRMHNLPTSWPQTTGASHPVCGGKIIRP